MIAVDTNVLLYSVDRHEPAKQQRAQQLLRELHESRESVVLLWQVLGEGTQQLRRWWTSGRLSSTDYERHVSAFRNLFPLALPTSDAFDFALRLSSRYSLSHWDSMLLGACLAVGVTVVYTEDMGSPRTIDGVSLINPFA